ncbi:MAG: glycoside hydrolase family 43 protein [candidate division Zixibacteria bacterium]|nr:glycoside hydrolase family 43 protein [candidate division Zixibacteria bacterium]
MAARTFRNPVISGFYSDPSICCAGDDFYLITSSLEYFPGLPIFHSRDLVHWQQIGHVLDRPSQLNLDDVGCSAGNYAPTIRYHAGRFYVVGTLRRPAEQGVNDINFVVTAENPAGPWSEPVTLIEIPGIIDPSLFFDDDGRAWYVANARVAEPPWPGYRDIWVQEFDAENLALIGEKTLLWNGAVKGAQAPEAPHIYKVDGIYYLLIAEGGTFHDHAVTIARSPSVTGPYEGNPRNPILTHRHLGLAFPITNPGHADLIQTKTGEWWMVALASRPYGGYYYNLGRETFLARVKWEDGWPIVNPGRGCLESEQVAPDLKPCPVPSLPACDHFDTPTLAFCWNFIRTPRSDFWSLSQRPGHLRLRLRPERLSDIANPSFVGQRQRHIDCAVRTSMAFAPQTPNEEAGLALVQNNNYHFRFTLALATDGGLEARVIRRKGGEEETLGVCRAVGVLHYLKMEAIGQDYAFYYAATPEAWVPIAEQVDGRILSTPVAGGFVGTMIGMYGSANGVSSESVVDFDYFEYLSLDR